MMLSGLFSEEPQTADPLAAAIAKLERFSANDEQVAQFKVVKTEVDAGKRKGLQQKDGLALLKQLRQPKAGAKYHK